MKKMRRLLILGCVLTLIFSLTACGKNEEDKGPGFSYNGDELAQNLVENTEYAVALNEKDLDLMLEDYEEKSKTDESYEALIEGLKQVKDLKKEVGTYVGFYLDDNDFPIYEVTEGKNSVTVKAKAKFDKDGKARDVVVTYTYEPSKEELIKSAISYEPQYSLGEKMKTAAKNTVIGMGVVILVLAFLSAFISLFAHVAKIERAFAGFHQWKDERKQKREAKKQGKDAQNLQSDTTDNVDSQVNTENNEEVEEEDDFEIIAVITAAIAASQTTGADGFVVRKVKRVSNSKWNRV